MTFLYFDKDTGKVYNEAHGNYETFSPTVDNTTGGFLVGIRYTTYDSFESSNEIHVEIIDLYQDKDQAIAVGEKIFAHQAKYPKTTLEIEFADGKVTKQFNFVFGWGYSIEDIFVQEVIIEKPLFNKVFR